MSIAPQRIVEIADYARQFEGVVSLCFGQADIASPIVARSAMIAALDRGETFYPDVRGIPSLRTALANYTSRLYQTAIHEERIAVTASGMAALNLAITAVVGPSDNVIVVAPFWPNTVSVVSLLGAEPRIVPLRADLAGHWALDLNAVFGAIDFRTRAIVINSPSNPTGWVASREELHAIVEFARQRSIWVISDEVYARITYDTQVAPSVLEVANEDDPILVVNSFSKTWAMTGWRIGWLTMPRSLLSAAAEMIECMTSGVTSFAQFGALAAILDGEEFVERFRAYCSRGRHITSEFLAGVDGIAYRAPTATFYAFFSVEGVKDSVEFAKLLVRESGVAIAPGAAFGNGFEGWFRLCFAQDPKLLAIGLERVRAGLASR